MKSTFDLTNLLKKIIKKVFSYQESTESSFKKEMAERAFVVYSAFVVLSIIIIIKVILISFQTPTYRLSKDIKIDLQRAIISNCNYDDLKIIYNKKERIDVRTSFVKKSSIYDVKVDLVYILEDMVFDFYTLNFKDTLYISRLKYFIKESKEKHPFDKLDESEKELFIKIRENSGESYQIISDDLISISEELNKKDETIELYLDKSYQSYILSIIALTLTILQITPFVWVKVKLYLNNKRK